MRKLSATLLGIVVSALAAGQAMAAPAACSNIYTAANGGQSYPGTYVGEVGNTGSGLICQIGKGYSNQGPTVINGATNPVIYSFYYAGGDLTIEQWVGNNGVFNASTDWNAYLVSLTDQFDTSANTLIATLDVPFSSGPSFAGTLYSGFLAAGFYAVKNAVADDYEDPQFQLNFASTSVPEPVTIGLLGASLLGLGFAARRRRS